MKNVTSTAQKMIARIVKDYDYDWDGFLYRAAPKDPKQAAIFYHVAPEGAEMYAKVHGSEVERHLVPNATMPVEIDFDYVGRPKKHKIGLDTVQEWQLASGVDDDPAIMVENVLPRLRAMGYDLVIINGETGAETTGPSVEVVDITPIRPIDGIASTLEGDK